MGVTQKQIAAALGMSRSLVGEALNGHPKISPQTRDRVLAMAAQLGYDPAANVEARRLVGRRYGRRAETRVLSIVLAATDTQQHEVGVTVFAGAHQAVRRNDYDLLIPERLHQRGVDLAAAILADQRSDGYIFVNHYGLRAVLDRLEDAGIPAVTCLSDDNPAGVPAVMADSHQAMGLAVECLVERGHRNIAFVAGPSDHSEASQRLVGFENAMVKRGLALPRNQIISGHWGVGHQELYATPALELVRRGGVTAFVCSNDHQALGIWDMAAEQEVSMPGQFSLVGMDDFLPARERGLTTIRNPLRDIGSIAVELLLARLQGGQNVPGRLVPVELVERASVAPPLPQ